MEKHHRLTHLAARLAGGIVDSQRGISQTFKFKLRGMSYRDSEPNRNSAHRRQETLLHYSSFFQLSAGPLLKSAR